MRNLIAKASLFCLLLLTFSCAKDTEYIDVDGTTDGYINAKIGSESFSFKPSSKAVYNILDKKTIEINAMVGKKMLGFSIDGVTGPGTYQISEDILALVVYASDVEDLETYFYSSSGSITITSINDKSIIGKFTATFNKDDPESTESLTITNAEFSVDLTKIQEHEHLGVNKFTAKLNGVLTGFKGQTIIAGVLNVEGRYGSKLMTLSLPSFNGIGTYQLSDIPLGDRLSYLPNDDAAGYVSTSGTAIITSISNNTLKGTFSGVLRNEDGATITISDGDFEIKDFEY